MFVATGGFGAAPPNGSVDDDSGCGCRVPNRESGSSGGAQAVALGLAVLALRARRRNSLGV
jgi:hypothetical protein